MSEKSSTFILRSNDYHANALLGFEGLNPDVITHIFSYLAGDSTSGLLSVSIRYIVIPLFLKVVGLTATIKMRKTKRIMYANTYESGKR